MVVDTGDGAAITFLGDPERALFAALAVLDKVGETAGAHGDQPRAGVTRQGHQRPDNVIGDGINVAAARDELRGQGQLLVSRSFFEVMPLLSARLRLAVQAGALAHSTSTTAPTTSSPSPTPCASAAACRKRRRGCGAASAAPFRVPEDDAPAQVFDAGTHFIVSARSQAKMQDAVHKLAGEGCQLLSPMAQVGSKWVASVGNPRLTVQAKVETFGFKRVITGPTVEAVRLKLQDLLERGAVLVQDAELADGVWTAVCEKT